MDNIRHGDLPRWQKALESLPHVKPSSIDLDKAVITLGCGSDLKEFERAALRQALLELIPWRKGPFRLFDIDIDAEWRSNRKWDRLAEKISPLVNRKVLDIGCGNGYYMWRMRAAGAKLVLGVDPNLLFNCQFKAVQHYAQESDIHLLPLGVDDLPPQTAYFDTVFSMGVLYHRASPIGFIKQLFGHIRPGGELVLETLVIDGDEQSVLVPESRYARMRNVWFVPSSRALALWLKRCGFRDIQIADESITSIEEQRCTPWMRYESLRESLNPDNPSLTIENLPIPKRAVLIATRK